MLAFVKLLEIDGQGHPKGNIIVNLNAVICAREVELPNSMKACRLVITELSADDIMASLHQTTASYSDSILVAWDLEHFAETLNSVNKPPKRKQ